MKDAPKKPGYHLQPLIETAAVIAMCGDPKFYAAVGHAIEAERLSSATAAKLCDAAHAVAKRFGGNGSSWNAFVLQHLADQMQAGRVTHAELEACRDYLIEAELSLPTMPTEELITAVLPTVQAARHKDALAEALASRAPAAQVVEAFDKVARLGHVPVAQAHAIEDIVADPNFFDDDPRERMLFGIPDLDLQVNGLEPEAIALFVGGSGSGKSMTLAHVAVENFLAGRHVLFVTLEMSVKQVVRRMMSNICDMTREEMRLDPTEAHRRLHLWQKQTGGMFRVAWAEPRVTSPRDLKRLVEQERKRAPGFDPKVFVIDFVDKLRTNLKDSHYDDMVQTTDGIRQLAVDVGGWSITASQATRKATNQPWLDLDDIADSMNKARSSDIVIAIGRDEEDKANDLIRFCIPKRREGDGANARIGPIPWDPQHGRVCTLDRSNPW